MPLHALDTKEPSLRALVKWALPLCCLLTLGLGIVKVFYQRAYPPPYAAGRPWNLYDGFVAIDKHGATAEAIRNWFTGADPGGVKLREIAENGLHPSAIVVPAATAALDLLVGSIAVSFMIVSACAMFANMWLAGRVVKEVDPFCAREAPPLAMLLVVAHCLTIRTSAQLILDPACAMFATATLLGALRWTRRPSLGSGLFLLTTQCLGLFTKVSYAPMLAVPPVAAIILLDTGRWRRTLTSGLLFAAVPAAAWASFIWLLTGSVNPVARESRHLLESRYFSADRFAHFAVEMALLFQGFAVAVLVKPWRIPGGAHVVLAALTLLLAATWSFHLPAIPRLYLTAVAPLAILTVVKLRDYLESPLTSLLVAGYVAANYVVAVVGLYIGN